MIYLEMFYVGEGSDQPCNFMMVPNLWIPNTQTLYKPVPLYIQKTFVNVPISSGRCLLGRRSRWRLISLTLVPKNRYPTSSSGFSSFSTYFDFDTLELVGTSPERVTGSAQDNP